MKDLILNNEEVRALSWKEPFASLMLHGKIETRTWDTKYRGLVLICASKKPYTFKEIYGLSQSNGLSDISDVLQLEPPFNKYELKSGLAIAIGRLVNSRPMEANDYHKTFTCFNSDLFCHIYEDVRAIVPFEWKGSQGWKRLTDEEKLKILFK